MQGIWKRWAANAVLLTLLLLTVGCATGPNANPKDPLEPMNRSITKFNDALDDNVLKPVATGYRDYTPELVQTGVGNFFRNLSDVLSTVNNGLQLKGRDTAESLMRVVVNTIFGIYGIFDVATPIGLERHPEDFGQTLGYWGVPDGPYLVLPIFGPSTVRDAAALPADRLLAFQVAHRWLEPALALAERQEVQRATDVAWQRQLAELGAWLGRPEVEIRARLPLVGLLGPSLLVVRGHAMAEP